MIYELYFLEHYADEFVRQGLKHFGVTLTQYLAAPDRIEAQYAELDWPLLPAQAAVKQRLDAEEARQQQRQAAAQRAAEYRIEAELADLPRRNGAAVEPLHHSRLHKRSRKCNFKRRARHAG